MVATVPQSRGICSCGNLGLTTPWSCGAIRFSLGRWSLAADIDDAAAHLPQVSQRMPG